MYTEIRRCLAIDYFDEFGPKSPIERERPLNDINSVEYQDRPDKTKKTGIEYQHFKTSPKCHEVACMWMLAFYDHGQPGYLTFQGSPPSCEQAFVLIW